METKEYIFQPESYFNYLELFRTSYLDIKRKLKGETYEKVPPRGNNPDEVFVEHCFDRGMPNQNSLVVDFCGREGTIPSQDEFRNLYIKECRKQLEGNEILEDRYIPWIERHCDRSYPSLIRDILFGKYLQEKFDIINRKTGSDYKVLMNKFLDYNAKIDVMIIGPKGNWGLHLFIGTEKSTELAKEKDETRRSVRFTNVKDIYLPIDMNGIEKDPTATIINGLFLYGDREYNKLLELARTQ